MLPQSALHSIRTYADADPYFPAPTQRRPGLFVSKHAPTGGCRTTKSAGRPTPWRRSRSTQRSPSSAPAAGARVRRKR